MSPTRRAVAIAGMLAACTGAAVAVAAAPTRPPLATSAAWTIDRAASRVSLTLSGDGGAVQGAFKRWTAQAAFDPARPAQAKVTLSIEAASLVTGDPARDQALAGPGALGAGHASRVVFSTRTVTPRPGGGFDAAGELTVAGRARPATAVLRFSREPTERRLDLELPLPPDVFVVPGRPRPAAAALAVRLSARNR